jgi:hypothetical protein
VKSTGESALSNAVRRAIAAGFTQGMESCNISKTPFQQEWR